MYSKFIQRYTFLSIFLIIFAFGCVVQSQLLLNVDVSWLVEASKRMLAGGTYTKDYFENNPPWILYFYTPPVIVAKLLSANIIVAVRMYVFLLSVVSLQICYTQLQKIFSKQDVILANLFLIVLTILFLVFPIFDFGQREHLLFILSMPYLLMITLRVQGHKVDSRLAMIIGLLAGSVFMMKPYFFMTLILVELYYLRHCMKSSNRARLLWRPEIAAITFLLLTYAGILYFRHPDYLKLVMPFAMRWCYLGTKKPWLTVIDNPLTTLCYMSIPFYLATYEINRYQVLTKILFLALIGFLFSYFIQHEDWPYHLLPAFSTAIAIYALLFSIYVTTPEKKKYIPMLVGCFILLMFCFLQHAIYVLNFYILQCPFVCFSYVAGIFASVLYLLSHQKKLRGIIYVRILFLSLLSGYLIYFATTKWMNWSGIQSTLIGLTLLFSFSGLIPGSYREKRYYLMVTLLGLFIFLFPFFQLFAVYNAFHKEKGLYEKLITYIDKNAAHQSVYFFTTNIANAFPTITYSKNTISGSRFSFFWALPGLVKQSYLPMDQALQVQLNKDKNFQIDMVTKDLVNNKPKLVFVDVANRKNSLVWTEFTKSKSISFEYLNYFRQNHQFNNAWKKYHYVTTLSENSINNINPFRYQFEFLQKIPKDKDIKFKHLYVFMNNNNLEIAVKNDRDDVRKFNMQLGKNDTDKKLFLALKQVTSKPRLRLDNKNKEAFFAWLSKQTVSSQLYKFNVYERVS